MKIRVKAKGGFYYVQQKNKRKAPVITPFEDKAIDYTNLAKCKNMRDDVLEFYPKAAIVA